ncbi:hypothetical protein Bca101_055073 [Brassica carinata]
MIGRGKRGGKRQNKKKNNSTREKVQEYNPAPIAEEFSGGNETQTDHHSATSQMISSIYGAQRKNEYDFKMKFDGVYYPLNDYIKWLSTFLEEMKKDFSKMQIEHAAEATKPTSIDSTNQPSIDDKHPSSDTYTRKEIDELVHGIYRALGTAKEYFTKGLDDVYYPINNSIAWLTTRTDDMKQTLATLQE